MNAQRTDASIVYELLSRFNARPQTDEEKRDNWTRITDLTEQWDQRYSTGMDA